MKFMSRPSKPTSVLEAEGKSHRTKAEIESRKKAEEAVKSGNKLVERPEVKADPVAHKEFLRVKKLAAVIDKDDALFSAVLNRYCTLYSECRQYEVLRDDALDVIEQVRADFAKIEFASAKQRSVETTKFITALEKLHKQIEKYDSMLMAKRKMMLDIEKENIMTVSSAMRAIPKTPEKAENPLLKALMEDE